MSVTFQTFGLRPELVQAVTELGYETPTPIQTGTIPLLLAGSDILGQAQTGTGKTAAFALPMLHALDPQCRAVQGLVVAPTRELANQVATAIHDYGSHQGVRVLPVYGGQSYSRQIGRLKRGVDVVVGTPGRMLDLIRKKSLDLSGVRFLVLDEADEMLSMGFIEDIEAILSETPETRQTALFSATLPKPIRNLADRYMHTPESVIINPKQLTVANVEQRYYVVRESDKLAALTRLLETETISSGLIFARTRVGTARLAEALFARGFQAEALHGELSQQARETVLGRFRRGRVTLVVATDVAARGLDIDDISHVINYDLPFNPEYYVHRIGRTGRAGKKGIAITLVTPQERWRVRKIEKYARCSISYAKLPSADQILARRDEQFMDLLADQLVQGQLERERDLVAKLAAAGCDPLDLAAAAIQLARAEEQHRPIEEIAQVHGPAKRRNYNRKAQDRRAPRGKHSRRKGKHEPGMVRLSMNVGKAHGMRPGEIVGAIAGTASISGKAIGAIRINQRQTYVDVTQKHVGLVLRKMRGWKLRGQAIVLELAR
ncbi:MAG: RNA helicase [Chloroflexi bacterium]|nr:MAG: RNA helicase [Chloroflexota bacterium]